MYNTALTKLIPKLRAKVRMSEVEMLQLVGSVPVVEVNSIEADVERASSTFSRQLDEWGFMALEIPGIRAMNAEVMENFRVACQSATPSLMDYVYTRVPQMAVGGNHGFFPMFSEIPRLAQGVADPKEFLHISGAIIEDLPPGSGAVLEAFSDLGHNAESLFDVGFNVASSIGRVICQIMTDESSVNLGLSRYSSILRLVHYIVSDQRDVLAHEHSGIQMLGVQFPPSDRGLQYILNDGRWAEPEIPNTDIVLCNIGRMLTKASAGRFRPSTHRVHRSSGEVTYERWSNVLFCHPDHRSQQWIIEEGSRSITVLDSLWGEFVGDMVRGLGIEAEAGD